MKFHATVVGIPDQDSREDGNSCDMLFFEWPDPLYGEEGLYIQLDGHCSCRTFLRSGNGPPEFVEVNRSNVKLRFTPKLAKYLEWDEEVEITFDITDEQYTELVKTVEHFKELSEWIAWHARGRTPPHPPFK